MLNFGLITLKHNSTSRQDDDDDDDECYRLTCAALSGEVASDVRAVLLQPFQTHKYANLKGV